MARPPWLPSAYPPGESDKPGQEGWVPTDLETAPYNPGEAASWSQLTPAHDSRLLCSPHTSKLWFSLGNLTLVEGTF